MFSTLFRQAASYTKLSSEEARAIEVATGHIPEDTHVLKAMQAFAEVAMSKAVSDERYEDLAVSCMVTYIHSQVPGKFSVAMGRVSTRIINADFMNFIVQNRDVLDNAIRHTNDFKYPYRGVLTLMKSYLILSEDGSPLERINHLLMRVAVANGYQTMSIEEILNIYRMLSERMISVATPVMFNSGTLSGAPISCYLLPVRDDSIEGIYDTLKTTALLARGAGGIGLNITGIRPKGDLIRSVNRESGGIVPMLKPYESTLAYVDQNKRRKGSAAIFIQPWHADIQDYLKLRTNEGDETTKCRSLFYGIWCPRLFFERVLNGEKWSLMSPVTCPGLKSAHGEAFEKLYLMYESQGLYKSQVDARELWKEIMVTECEIGMPYIHNGCLLNHTSNQRNLGTIECSNLCAEIVEFSSPEETACCVLGSVVLSRIVRCDPNTNKPLTGRKMSIVERLDLKLLREMVSSLVRLLNCLIDVAKYVDATTLRSNLRHRPLGIGVQAFDELLEILDLAFEDSETDLVNTAVFETMYYAAIMESIEQAKLHGPYDTFPGCPARTGKLHFDLHGEYLQKYHTKYVGHRTLGIREEHLKVRHTLNPDGTRMYDWDMVREQIKLHGLRNSLLIALMPTQSTSLILGNTESTYAKASNLFKHNMLAGSFIITNRNMVSDLREIGLWTDSVRQRIIAGEGSIQHIHEIPERLRRKYKTAFEIDPYRMIDLAADRQWWICQSQSFDHNIIDPTPTKLTKLYLYSYARGNGTVGYYTRSNPAVAGLKFVIDAKLDLETRAGKNLSVLPQQIDPLDSCAGGACQA